MTAPAHNPEAEVRRRTIGIVWTKDPRDHYLTHGTVGTMRAFSLVHGQRLTCYLPGPKGWRPIIECASEKEARAQAGRILREVLAAFTAQ